MAELIINRVIEMNKTGFFSDERCFWHTTSQHTLVLPISQWVQPSTSGGHAESPESKRRLKNLMDVSGISSLLALETATPATREAILRVHTQRYLDELFEKSSQGAGSVGLQAPIAYGTYETAALSAGLAIGAVNAVMSGELDNAYALSRPPGHHARPDEGLGFCYLSNIAIAIEEAKSKFGIERVAVLDWDVHHGNGTQEIFYNRSDVLTISLHQAGAFPKGYTGECERGSGEGVGYNINIPLNPGSGGAAYAHAMERIVKPALNNFKPELIIVACGYDASSLDPLGRMMLSSDDFRNLTLSVMESAKELCNNRLVMIHEGGYSEAYVPFCGLAVIESLLGARTEVEDIMVSSIKEQQANDAYQKLQLEEIDKLAGQFNL